MKNLPIVLKAVINIILFFVYYFIASFLGWFVLGIISMIAGFDIPTDTADPMYLKLSGIIFVIVLIATILLRKYFYISCKKDVVEAKK